MSRISLFPRQSRLSRAVRAALAILALGAAASAWAAGTAAGEATASPASASGPAPLVITVQPGQSLNDIAIAATQSHDPGVLARAGRALFDANPQAFMKRDPSRLKVGATLTVPALDANGAALAPAGASGAAAASAAVAASAGAASMQHAASMPHGASSVASAASAASAAQRGAASGANGAAAPAGASASSAVSAASAAHGASFVAGAASASSAAAAAGASGPHMWSGAIQSAPSSASDAAVQPAPGAGTRAASEPVGAAPVAAASQPRPSSLQQLLALKNRVLMELQKHGIGKPAATTAVAPAPAPVAPRSTPGEAGASAAVASPASAAASDVAASAAQPASASGQAAAPVVTPPPANRAEQQIDWRPASLAGAAVVVLAAGFLLRKRRKARQADAAAASAAAGGGAPAAAVPEVEQELPIQPEMPVARDAAADMTLAAATAAAAETVAPPDAEAAPSSSPEAAEEMDATHPHLPPADAELPQTGDASAPTHDAKPAEVAEPTEAPVVPPATDAQHAALMQNAITALGSLDMPLPPRTPGESSLTADESGSPEDHFRAPQIATNGQTAAHPPMGAADPAPEYPADHDDELEWDPDDAPARSSAPSSLPPLGGAQFGALKLDFDLDLPRTPGAVLPALTPEELARIARNKLDLAAEYVELGDLSGARTLLQEVVDANDAATRDDARALLAKLADEA
ncbi:FimV/HubP family polar landmark protein [Burkholderia pseudomultivorans]|uniref:FimV/HubP family polar landmark protein n=1 Tax=Burkholderia pseudomultivorans TaxID=1207504 RepID=UPI00075E59A1|nr:FimV/HubP family polar landmark protein [Burkholderia pseudomultivorans]KVG64102.1 pilus assembly protein FimV [Burkholderia pseudomultivorans]